MNFRDIQGNISINVKDYYGNNTSVGMITQSSSSLQYKVKDYQYRISLSTSNDNVTKADFDLSVIKHQGAIVTNYPIEGYVGSNGKTNLNKDALHSQWLNIIPGKDIYIRGFSTSNASLITFFDKD